MDIRYTLPIFYGISRYSERVLPISWFCINQLCVFKEFCYLDLQICGFFPQNERQKVHFPLCLKPGPLLALVSPKLPCTFKISIEFAFQMEFQSFKRDCGKSEGLEAQVRTVLPWSVQNTHSSSGICIDFTLSPFCPQLPRTVPALVCPFSRLCLPSFPWIHLDSF